MDNTSLEKALIEGAEQLGVRIDVPSARSLVAYEEELLRWNERVNLVGRRSAPIEVLEKHILDSLAVAPEVAAAASLIDIGAGAGFPGIPLKVASPRMTVTLVDSIGKKAAFMRHAVGKLGLGPGIDIRQARAQGSPAKEQLPRAQVAISRALVALPHWLRLAFFYVVPGGQVVAMLSRADDSAISDAARQSGATLVSARRYQLPFSRAARMVAVFEQRRGGG